MQNEIDDSGFTEVCHHTGGYDREKINNRKVRESAFGEDSEKRE